MEAKRENIVNKERTALNKVLPLSTPYSLFVDVCNACNFKCKFCAIQTAGRELPFKKICMTWENYKKVIDDLCAFDEPLRMLRLAANGEPLVNKRLPDMIRYAKEKGVTDHIEIVSNGSLLNPEFSDAIIEAGLDRIRISIEGPDAATYKDICEVDIDWNEFLRNIQYFFDHRKQCNVYIKTVDAAVDTKEKEKLFFDTFEKMSDNISIEHVIPIWTGYDEIYDDFDIDKTEGLHGHKIHEVEACPFPFYSCVINPDGEVTACCNDWERKISLGNAFEESIVEIWKGKQYFDFLTGMLKNGRKKNHPQGCANCRYPCYDAVDSIDEHREEILKNFNKNFCTE